jgi:hypothetical protein
VGRLTSSWEHDQAKSDIFVMLQHLGMNYSLVNLLLLLDSSGSLLFKFVVLKATSHLVLVLRLAACSTIV